MYLYYMPVMPNQLKENINRIKSLISEFYPDDTPDEPGYTGFPLEDGVEPNKGEGNMAKHQAMECSSDSADVAKMIHEDMNLPEWLEAKITLSADYMNVVKDYLTHNMGGGKEQNEPLIKISYDEESMEYELGEQEGTESGESDDGGGAGTASMGVWDSGIARGVANQVTNSKWSDSYATTRGKANPLV